MPTQTLTHSFIRSKQMRYPSAILGILFVSAVAAGQDAITRRDGTVLQCRVLSFEKGKFVVDEGGDAPRSIRVTDIEKIDFERREGGIAPRAAAAAPVPAPAPAPADQSLEGEDLTAWKLARSYVMSNHNYWMPDNAMPVRDAIQVTATGDYLVAIPVASKPEPGFGQNFGIYFVQVTKFETSLRVDGDNFQRTDGPYRPRTGRTPQRKTK
jgi:hypothetical protein